MQNKSLAELKLIYGSDLTSIEKIIDAHIAEETGKIKRKKLNTIRHRRTEKDCDSTKTTTQWVRICRQLTQY